MSRRRKTILYFLFIGVFIYTVVYVEYFSEEFSPLQVLSDARSEAKRLLKFILLYQYQCNSTIQTSNFSVWPICTETNGGIDIELKSSKVAYSIGPSEDGEFEKLLISNLSFTVYIFTHHSIHTSEFFLQNKQNNTHVYRTTIVPNDPADFSRNSYDTQTVNNLLTILRHKHLDILKIDNVADNSRSHDILYYLIKDGTMKNVDQLHIVLRIDKADDEYLYSWYRTLYNLFHQSGFRLYHTTASDSPCLQVTLMESCIYYMSWIKDPGPQTFILYPPAIDGSLEFELERLTDYQDNPEVSCDSVVDVVLAQPQPLLVCMDDVNRISTKQCRLIILRDRSESYENNDIPVISNCKVVVLLGRDLSADNGEIIEVFENGFRKSQNLPLLEALDRHLSYSSSSNILYLDVPDLFWNLISPVLNSGVLQLVYQLFIDINILNNQADVSANLVRQMYSELKRIEAYGFKLHQSSKSGKRSHPGNTVKCCNRLSYIKTKFIHLNK